MFDDPVSQGNLVGGLRQARSTIANMEAAVHQAKSVIQANNDDQQNALVADLRAEVTKFARWPSRNWPMRKVNKAMFDAMKAHHPDNPMLADSGKRYKDGDIKTHARLHYEVAYDRIILDHGLTNPETFRAD